ncbi:MAG: MBL fold metallo-hydrolase [Rhodobacteraceae bacterium]|nr:MBL fold metallo-hydrolase [Paracoccaceae bacterium]
MIVKTLAAVALFACAASPAFAQDTKRAITNVKGDVWRFQNNFHFSVFVITDDGVIVSDPINAEAAAWLKNEISKLTDAPITHLVYSHSHGDHASGGAVFADTATVFAGANGPAEIDGVIPDMQVSEGINFTSGDHSFEITPLGSGHGSDMLALVIRPENVAFIVDVVTPKRLPFKNFPGADIGGYIDQIRVVETLEFDVLVPGHGGLGGKVDATENRQYVEWLRDAVTADLKQGNSVEEIVASLDTSAYADWGNYESWRDLNIRGMADWLVESGALN